MTESVRHPDQGKETLESVKEEKMTITQTEERKWISYQLENNQLEISET